MHYTQRLHRRRGGYGGTKLHGGHSILWAQELILPGPHLGPSCTTLNATIGLGVATEGGSHPDKIPRFKFESRSYRKSCAIAVIWTFLHSTSLDVNHEPYLWLSCTTLLLTFFNLGAGSFANFWVLGITTCFIYFQNTNCKPIFLILGPGELPLGGLYLTGYNPHGGSRTMGRS